MDKQLSISLSGAEVLKLLDNKANLFSYSQLHNIKSIDELLGQYKKAVLLYHTSANYGHYVCVWEYNNTIFFFDSYGGVVDSQLKFLPKDLKKELNSNHNYLIRLMYNSGLNVEFNQYQLQSREPNITTCGRHCVERLRFPEISIDEYYKIFKEASKFMPIDELIVLLVPL